MHEQPPSGENREIMKMRERLVASLRERGPENEETRKAFLTWKVFGEEAAQRCEDPRIAEERLQVLRDIFRAEDSFAKTQERLRAWESERSIAEGDKIPRIPNREAEIRLIVDEAAVYEEAGFPEEAREILQDAMQQASQEAQAAAELQKDFEQFHTFMTLMKEIADKM